MTYSYLDLETLLRIPNVESEHGFDISPDGRRVAFSWNRSGRWEIYEMPLSPPGEPVQVSAGPGAKLAPRYAPDGRRLAYLLDLDGSEAYDLWLTDLDTGASRNLTPDTSFLLQPDYDWFPDGRRIALISEHSGRFCTHILEIGGAPLAETSPVLVCDGPQCQLSLSPDGARLVVASEARGQDTWLTVVFLNVPDKGGGFHQRVVRQAGSPLNGRDACWSPNGKNLVFASDFRGDYQIGLYDVENEVLGWVTDVPGDKTNPDWSPDGKRLAWIAARGADTWLEVYTLGTGIAPQRSQMEPGVVYAPRFTPDGRSLIFIFDNPRHPDDLWRIDLAGEDYQLGAAQLLTRSLPAELAEAGFVMPEEITYSAPDGKSVPALLYLPGGRERCLAEKPPAVVVIHGGPSWLFPFLWYPVMTHLASRGWVVLAPNYRGSTGYGRQWQLANRFEMGRLDTQDCIAGAEYLVRAGLADPRRIAVSGRSHGGYLTMSCLVTAPDVWAGGSAIVPFLNWFTSHAGSRDDLKHWDIENMGNPVDYADLWRERSPFFFLDRIQAPVQLIGGENDPRCPPSEAIAAHQALLELGKDAELLIYPDEGHAFLKIENVIDHELRRVEFLKRVIERI